MPWVALKMTIQTYVAAPDTTLVRVDQFPDVGEVVVIVALPQSTNGPPIAWVFSAADGE
jgi:hypothetical protein